METFLIGFAISLISGLVLLYILKKELFSQSSKSGPAKYFGPDEQFAIKKEKDIHDVSFDVSGPLYQSQEGIMELTRLRRENKRLMAKKSHLEKLKRKKPTWIQQ